jgi:TolB-like protein/Tfp pilus assembly protein PilF
MSKQPSSLQAFFAEMKRRRVFRVMAMYGVVAFIVLQIADLVFPILGLPDWTLQFVLMLTLLGFPIAVVIAWAFEATDEGIRRAEPAPPELIQAIVAQPASKRWPAGLLALAGVILVFGGGWWMGNRSLGDGEANIIVPSAQASDFKAIAALPFANVNGDEENRLIAVGVHEDLLSQLQRISAFRVTGRTSVREYADTEKTFDQIAEELGVEYLLDGSVRSSGSQVVVTVALMDAASGEQLWTQRYDEAFTPENLFDIQSQIAREVVDALEAELTPQDVATLEAMSPGSDLAAQTRYHRAVELYESSTLNAEDARDELLAAVQIDPDFVAAWSRLAHMQSWLVQSGQAEVADARAAVERTVELAPGTVEAHLAHGFFEYYAQRDFDSALSSFREAERLAPSDAEVVWAVSLILRRQGDWEGSTAKMKRAVQLDPRSLQKLSSLRGNLERTGAFEDADAVAERALSVHPGNAGARVAKAWSLADVDGGVERMRRFVSELGFDESDLQEGSVLLDLALIDRDYEHALEIIEGMEWPDQPVFAASRLAFQTVLLDQVNDSVGARQAADSLLAAMEDVEDLESTESVLRMIAYAGLDQRDNLRREIEAAEARIRQREDATVDPGWAGNVVWAYGVLGDLDAGFELLADIVERPDNLASWEMRSVLWFDVYRDDPRFEEMVQRREAFEAEGQRKAAEMRPFLP